jgi:hypothetical protein
MSDKSYRLGFSTTESTTIVAIDRWGDYLPSFILSLGLTDTKDINTVTQIPNSATYDDQELHFHLLDDPLVLKNVRINYRLDFSLGYYRLIISTNTSSKYKQEQQAESEIVNSFLV